MNFGRALRSIVLSLPVTIKVTRVNESDIMRLFRMKIKIFSQSLYFPLQQ
ncbi:hypothetical protein H3S83_08490 [Bartonella sp. W8122]|nr:hypothetical protein [Bartonella sp. W8122]